MRTAVSRLPATAGKWRACAAGKEYKELSQLARSNPSEFWASRARSLPHRLKPWDVAGGSDFSVPRIFWFQGGRLNAAYNCVDRHIITGHRNKAALICRASAEWRSTPIPTRCFIPMCAACGALGRARHQERRLRGLVSPMVPEPVITMLACALLGDVHTNSFTGYAEGAVQGSPMTPGPRSSSRQTWSCVAACPRRSRQTWTGSLPTVPLCRR